LPTIQGEPRSGITPAFTGPPSGLTSMHVNGAAAAPVFTGVGVALVTLFEDDGSLDLDAPATADLARQLVDAGGGVIVLTDMFGGTPCNLALPFHQEGKVEILTGVNLPMVVKFATLPQDGKDLTAVAHTISEKGSKAIRVASELLTAERRAS